MPQVTIYSTPICPYCVIAKKYFEDKNVKYLEIDVSQNEKEAQKMQKKSGQLRVPVIIIKKNKKEKVIAGFDKEQIDRLLDLK